MQNQVNSFYCHNQKKIYIIYTDHFNFLKINNISIKMQNNKLYLFGLHAYTTTFKYNYNLLKKLTFSKYRLLLKLNGLNFKFTLFSQYLQCNLGYSHLIYILLPKGLHLTVLDDKKNLLLIECFNYSLVTSLVNILKKIKPINPYNLTGICLNSTVIVKKTGKKK